MPDSFVFIRHGRPAVAPEDPPGQWGLTADGIADIRDLGGWLRDNLDVRFAEVVASAEPKARQTAEHLDLGIVMIDDRVREVSRPWYDDQSEFEAATVDYLTGTDQDGWEPHSDAVARFNAAVGDSKAHLTFVVTHGTVLSAWLRAALGQFDAPSFWNNLRFADAWLLDLSSHKFGRIGPSLSSGQS